MKKYGISRRDRLIIMILVPSILVIFYTFINYNFWQEDNVPGRSLWSWVPLALLFTSILVYGLIEAIVSKVIIENNRIIEISVFQKKELKAEQISGYRIDLSHIIILPIGKREKKLRIKRRYENAEEIIEWLEGFCDDLDYLKAQKELQEKLDSEHQGFTGPDFDKRISNSKKTAALLNWSAGSLAVWTVFYPTPYDFLIISLIILFVLCLILLRVKNGLLQFLNPDNSLYPSIIIAFVSISFSLVLRSMEDYRLLNYYKVWGFAIFTGILFTIVCVVGRKEFYAKNKIHFGSVMFCFAIMLVCSYAITVLINCRYDHSNPKVFKAQVLNKKIVSGKTTTYYFDVSSWSSIEKIEEVTVSKVLYNKTNEGEIISIDVMKGNFGIPWFEISP